jgi:ribosomal protein L14
MRQELRPKPATGAYTALKGVLESRELRIGQYKEVVRVESPIHKDEIARRIADAAGVHRIGNRIKTTIKAALHEAVRAKRIWQRGDFFWFDGNALVVVRDRCELPIGSRKLELVAPEELSEAIVLVVRSAFGINLADIPQAVCRLLGFGRTSGDMAALVDSLVRKLSSAGTLLVADGHVTLIDKKGSDAIPIASNRF